MTAPGTETEPAPRALREVGRFVDQRVGDLQRRALRGESAATATLARLRRGVEKAPGEVPDLLLHTHCDAFVRGDEPSFQERAVHLAMTLFAVHQQSQGEPMHIRGRGVGAALRSLDTNSELPEALARRFRVLGSSEELSELTHHVRGVIQLLRQGRRPLDYGRLADQLVSWQYPDGAARVRLQWGREFYRTANVTAEHEGADS